MRLFQQTTDPYSRPSFSFANRFARLAWGIVYSLFFRPSPRTFFKWRAFLLKCFGAKIGPGCRIYRLSQIWAPWNLQCDDVVAIADEAIVYNPSPIRLGSHSVISQQAYLCGASHDYTTPDFSLISQPISIGSYAWICARATVQMGITVNEGAVLALGAVATKHLDPWTVYAGIPAKQIGIRPKFDGNVAGSASCAY